MVMTLNHDYELWSNGEFDIGPYVERSTSHDLTTLVRRRINAMVLFIHAIIIGRFNAPALRTKLNLFRGVRSLRNPEFIRLKTHKLEYLDFSPFNCACSAFNFAAMFIDPSLPHHDFKAKLIRLPDTAFGPRTKL